MGYRLQSKTLLRGSCCSGDLALEDIPVRLARYGLMEPNAFVDEMRERMELATKVNAAARLTKNLAKDG